MTPYRRMVDICAQQSMRRRTRPEEQVFAPVIAAREAGFAGEAHDVGFDCDSISHLVCRHGGMDGNDLAGGFVA